VRDPAGQLSLQPEALGAAQEETNGLKHSKRKASFGRSASRAGCNEQWAVVGRLRDFAAQVGDGLDHLGWVKRRQLIRTRVAKVEIDEGGATVVYRVPMLGSPRGPPNPPGSGCGVTGIHPR